MVLADADAMTTGRHFCSHDVVDVLSGLVAQHGAPGFIRCDNGPEFVAVAIITWLAKLDVGTLNIEPGSPWQNGYAESFVGRLRDELDRKLFDNLAEARVLLEDFRRTYNHERPHSSLGYMTPAQFAARSSVPLGPMALPESSAVHQDNLAPIGVGT